MARKTRKTRLSRRFHAPREERVVASIEVENGERVPRICLSGAWLERVGFRRGVQYLVLADVPNQILLVLTDP